MHIRYLGIYVSVPRPHLLRRRYFVRLRSCKAGDLQPSGSERIDHYPHHLDSTAPATRNTHPSRIQTPHALSVCEYLNVAHNNAHFLLACLRTYVSTNGRFAQRNNCTDTACRLRKIPRVHQPVRNNKPSARPLTLLRVSENKHSTTPDLSKGSKWLS